MKHISLLFLTLGVLVSIGLHQKFFGIPLFALSLFFAWKESNEFRIHMFAITLPFLILNLVPITTDTSTGHFIIMGVACLLALLLPYFILRKIRPLKVHLFSPKQWSPLSIGYLVLAFGLAYFILPWYFNTFPEVPAMWPQPEVMTFDSFMRLFIGTNLLGIWDEFFFINTVFAVLLRFFDFKTALVAQAVMFTSFLYELGFIAIGPFLIGAFAILQGLAYRRTESLSYVIMLHLIIDAVLFFTIMNFYYPGTFPLFG